MKSFLLTFYYFLYSISLIGKVLDNQLNVEGSKVSFPIQFIVGDKSIWSGDVSITVGTYLNFTLIEMVYLY